jgi:peptidyl-tRNA hydrolase
MTTEPPERDPDPFVMYIIIRRSLKLSKGKVGAQCGHAVQYMMQDDSLHERWPTKEETALRSKQVVHPETLTDTDRANIEKMEAESHARCERHDHFREWSRGDHAKIVLGATDDEFMKVQLENDPVFMVVDLGYTQVAPNTETGLGLWPMRKSWASPTVKSLLPL